MKTAHFATAILAGLSFLAIGCGSGAQPKTAAKPKSGQIAQSDPGYGMRGPGNGPMSPMLTGPNGSSSVVSQDGKPGVAGRGKHGEHNRLPGTGERP